MKIKNSLQSILLMLLMTLPLPILAQGQVANRLIRGSNFQIAVGYNFQRVNLDKMNVLIKAKGFPDISENIHSISFITQNISNNWIATLKTSYSLTNEVKFNNKEIEYKNQQYSLGIGYNVLASEKIRLLPSLMATLGSNNLLIQNKANASSNFQDLLQNPAQEADLRNYSYIADTGIEFHYQFHRRDRERDTGTSSTWIPLILKAGYLFEFGSSDTKFDGQAVAGIPDMSLSGFYASLHIGLGSRLQPLK